MNNIINTKIGTRQWDAYLQCYAAVVTGLNEPTTMSIFPVSQSWYNGTGKYLDQILLVDDIPKFKERRVILDSKRVDTLMVFPI
jgi:hypothetical protein